MTAQAFDGFANFTARLGLGADNVLSDADYLISALTRNRQRLEAMYRCSWVVGVCVDAVAEDMTRAGVSINSTQEPDQIGVMHQQLSRLGIWQGLLEAIKWGRLYGGAVACIVIDGQNPASPLNVEAVKKGQFNGLKVYDRWMIEPDLKTVVQSGMSAGMPVFYDVLGDPVMRTPTGLRWHHSRVVRFIGVQLPPWQSISESLWGQSIVERIEDRLVAFDTATSGAANLIQRAHLRTVQIDGLREILAAGGAAEKNLLEMFHHMRKLQTSEGITLLDKTDLFSTTQYSFAGLNEMLLQFGQQIAGAAGIPMTRLFGQSPGGLNATGESDIRFYYDNIFSQQESRLRDGMTRILHVLHASLFNAPPPEGFDFDFVPLWQTSQAEKASIGNSVVTAVATAYEKGVIDQVTALQELRQSSDYTGMFTNITDEQIEEAKIEDPPDAPDDDVPGDDVPGDPDEDDPEAKPTTAPAADSQTLLKKLKAWAGR